MGIGEVSFEAWLGPYPVPLISSIASCPNGMHHCTITVVDVTGINDDWLADPDSVPQQVKPA